MKKRSKKDNSVVKQIFIFLFIFIVLILFLNSVNAGSPTLLENITWYQDLTGLMHSAAVIGDINNDSYLDLITAGCVGGAPTSCTVIGNTKVYTNNQSSLVENSTWQQNLVNVSWSSLALGDIDNDGDLDLGLVGYNGTSGITKIYTNNQSEFVENRSWQQNLTTTNAYKGAVVFGDIDNDGDLDLGLIGADSINENGIYINNGTSFVKNSKWLGSLPRIGQRVWDGGSMTFGDIDNDGDLDLIVIGESFTNFYRQVYINNGTSLVEDSKWEDFSNIFGEGSLSLGDFDNDGDLDLVCIGVKSGDHFYLMVNNGTSFVENQTDSNPFAGVFRGSIGFGDYDNDGYLDLAGLGQEAGRSLVYLNNNTKYDIDEVAHSNISNNLIQGALAWSDINNDSKLDLFTIAKDFSVPSNYIAKIYTNNITTTNTKPTPPKQFTNYTTEDGNIHLGWGNGSDTETPSNGLYYNIRVGSSSGGNEIISGKYGGGEDNGYFGNMMQIKNFTLKTTRLLPNTQYFWSVQSIDTGLRASTWGAEKDFTTLGDLTTPTIISNAPINNYNSSSFNILFNATVYDNVNVSNVTLYSNWSGTWAINFTNSSFINNSNALFDIKLNQEGDGYYIWTIRSCDNSSLCSWGENRTFLVDTHWPNISLMSPANNTILTSTSISFIYNVTDKAIDNCSLIINNLVDQTDYTVNINTQQSFSKTLSDGSYRWSVNCTDSTNHTNSSSIRKFIVEIPRGGGISHGGKRAYTKPAEKPVEKKKEKTVIKSENFEKIKATEVGKPRMVSIFEIIYAFLVSLFVILSYIWIIREDFPKK